MTVPSAPTRPSLHAPVPFRRSAVRRRCVMRHAAEFAPSAWSRYREFAAATVGRSLQGAGWEGGGARFPRRAEGSHGCGAGVGLPPTHRQRQRDHAVIVITLGRAVGDGAASADLVLPPSPRPWQTGLSLTGQEIEGVGRGTALHGAPAEASSISHLGHVCSQTRQARERSHSHRGSPPGLSRSPSPWNRCCTRTS